MSRARFYTDRRDWLQLDLAVDPLIREVAQDVRDDAEDGSPTGATGDLKDGWVVERRSPAVYRVANTTDYAPFVEFGNGNPGTAVGMFDRAIADARSRYGAR